MPLSDVPIAGATDDEEAAHRTALAMAEDTYDLSEVELRRIRVVDLKPRRDETDPVGTYWRDRIDLERQAIPEMRSTLRHDLCHAMDDAL